MPRLLRERMGRKTPERVQGEGPWVSSDWVPRVVPLKPGPCHPGPAPSQLGCHPRGQPPWEGASPPPASVSPLSRTELGAPGPRGPLEPGGLSGV